MYFKWNYETHIASIPRTYKTFVGSGFFLKFTVFMPDINTL